MMKNIALWVCLLLNFHFLAAQTGNLQWLDIELSNYQYPNEVSFLELNIQEQNLKMAYMDVMPETYNGKNMVLFHGKNFNGAY